MPSITHTLSDVGAVVVAHATLDRAETCVDSLLRTLPADAVVVVVNSPNAIEHDALRRLAQRAAVVSPPAPAGYGANVNLGVRHLRAGVSFALLANDDVIFLHDAVAELVAALRANSRAACVGAQLLDADRRPVESTGAFPTAVNALARAGAPSRPQQLLADLDGRRREQLRARYDMRVAPPAHPADWVVGAALAVRLEAYAEVGGFDERFVLYFEETDLCYRLWEAGWTVATVPTARVVHEQGQSTAGPRYRRMLLLARRQYLRTRIGPVRWAALEAALAATFLASAAWSAAAIALRPASAGRRTAAVRAAWERRLFLRGR